MDAIENAITTLARAKAYEDLSQMPELVTTIDFLIEAVSELENRIRTLEKLTYESLKYTE